MNPIIKLSNNAALRIKEIMSNAEKNAVGVRVSVKSGRCAGMSYVMEYSKKVNPNDELIEDKGVKVYIDSAAVMYLGAKVIKTKGIATQNIHIAGIIK